MANINKEKWDHDAHAKLCVALVEGMIAGGCSPSSQKEAILASWDHYVTYQRIQPRPGLPGASSGLRELVLRTANL